MYFIMSNIHRNTVSNVFPEHLNEGHFYIYFLEDR